MLGFAAPRNAVVVGDLVVNTKQDGLSLGRQHRAPQRTAHTLDPHLPWAVALGVTAAWLRIRIET